MLQFVASSVKSRQEIYRESLTTINYMLLGLRETAKIINLNSFKFWQHVNYKQLTRNYTFRMTRIIAERTKTE